MIDTQIHVLSIFLIIIILWYIWGVIYCCVFMQSPVSVPAPAQERLF